MAEYVVDRPIHLNRLYQYSQMRATKCDMTCTNQIPSGRLVGMPGRRGYLAGVSPVLSMRIRT
jgi:hypothetical protein